MSLPIWLALYWQSRDAFFIIILYSNFPVPLGYIPVALILFQVPRECFYRRPGSYLHFVQVVVIFSRFLMSVKANFRRVYQLYPVKSSLRPVIQQTLVSSFPLNIWPLFCLCFRAALGPGHARPARVSILERPRVRKVAQDLGQGGQFAPVPTPQGTPARPISALRHKSHKEPHLVQKKVPGPRYVWGSSSPTAAAFLVSSCLVEGIVGF